MIYFITIRDMNSTTFYKGECEIFADCILIGNSFIPMEFVTINPLFIAFNI